MRKGIRIAALAAVLATASWLQSAHAVGPVTPNYCGDYCENEGYRVGCIDTSGSVWRKVLCTCHNGHLTC